MSLKSTIIQRVIIFALFIIGFAVVQSGQGFEKKSRIDRLLKTYQQYGMFNGTALVAEQGQPILKQGYGLAQIEWKIPNAVDTKFKLASISKHFTAIAIMQLVEQGKIRLDSPIAVYLPNYRTDVADKVTVHHLLSHTSGIPNYSLRAFGKTVDPGPYSPMMFIKKFCSRKPLFEPGTKFSYSNTGYVILGGIIEQVSGISYEKYLKENIFSRINMVQSGYDRHSKIIPKRASGYIKKENHLINTPHLDLSLLHSAGAIYSTVEDLYRWDRAMAVNRLLSAESKQILYRSNLRNQAYGCMIQQKTIGNQKKRIIYIDGGIQGFTSLILRFVDDNHLIVLLDNSSSPHLDRIAKKIINILYELPDTVAKKPLMPVLDHLIRMGGNDAVLKRYQVFMKNPNSEYELIENEVNRFGYRYLGKKKYDTAIALFKINVKHFPDSFNAYDSLAEAYMLSGKNALAISHYRKSLELNPKNNNAKEQIRKMAEGN